MSPRDQRQGLTKSPGLSAWPLYQPLLLLTTCPANKGPVACGGEAIFHVSPQGVHREAGRAGRAALGCVLSQKCGVSSGGRESPISRRSWPELPGSIFAVRCHIPLALLAFDRPQGIPQVPTVSPSIHWACC